MNSSDVEKLHARILHVLMDSDIFEDEAHLLSFPEEGYFLKAAYVHAIEEPEVNMVLGLPSQTDKVFVTVTDGDVDKVANVVSHLEEMVIKGKDIGNHHVVRFDSAYLKANEVEGLIILPVSISPALKHVPSKLKFNDREVSFHLLIFLSKDEYLYWKLNGNDKLMGKFELDGKDLIRITQLV